MVKDLDGLDLAEALHELELKGFRANGQVRPNGQIRCGACGRDFPAATMGILAHSRIEGVSDPADESLVIGVRCPGCHELGALVLAYGSRIGRYDADVLGRLGFLGNGSIR